MKMMGIDVLEHTERKLSFQEARLLYASMAEQVFIQGGSKHTHAPFTLYTF